MKGPHALLTFRGGKSYVILYSLVHIGNSLVVLGEIVNSKQIKMH